MRFNFVALAMCLALGLGGLSCGKSGPAGGDAAQSAGALTAPPAAAQPAASPAAEAIGPSIPKDAQWTIYCTTLNGPRHAAMARDLKTQLAQSTRLRDWYVMQSDQESTLYYGFYSSEKDSRAKGDRAAIAALVSRSGERLFTQPCLMPLESADPTAPPEWNLANTGKEYTLEIAAYRDDPRRKEAAVQAVREARAQGVEAYYFHGRTSSIVCVGAWPAEAIQEPTDVRAENPNELVVVATNNPRMPDNFDQFGRTVRIVHPECKINDPSITEAVKRYPLHLTNGAEVRRKIKEVNAAKPVVISEPSAIIHIPKKEGSGFRVQGSEKGGAPLLNPEARTPNPSPEPRTLNPKPPRPAQPPAGGKLRSLED